MKIVCSIEGLNPKEIKQRMDKAKIKPETAIIIEGEEDMLIFNKPIEAEALLYLITEQKSVPPQT